MSTEDYSFVDFGFSAVDKPPEPEDQPLAIDENDIMRVILNALAPLEDKLDLLLQHKDNAENEDLLNAISNAEMTVNEKLQALEKLIMPLLANLLKTAEGGDYLYWPATKRTEQTQSMINQILSITRS